MRERKMVTPCRNDENGAQHQSLPRNQEEDRMKRGSTISLVLGAAAFLLYGLFTKDWQTAILIGMGLAGFGGAGLAGLGKARSGRGGTTIPGGTEQAPTQRPKG